MNRAEHLAWAYIDGGDSGMALPSLISDLEKHPDTARAGRVVAELGMSLAVAGHLRTPEQMREWINGVG